MLRFSIREQTDYDKKRLQLSIATSTTLLDLQLLKGLCVT
jgi:hypothetical protein